MSNKAFPSTEQEYKDFFNSLLKEKLQEKLEIFETIAKDAILNEASPKLILRVNFRGQRIKKRICPRGFHLVGTRCVPFSSKQKISKKVAIRKAVRTKKADVTGKKRSTMKRLLALKKRKQQGIKSSVISR